MKVTKGKIEEILVAKTHMIQVFCGFRAFRGS